MKGEAGKAYGISNQQSSAQTVKEIQKEVIFGD